MRWLILFYLTACASEPAPAPAPAPASAPAAAPPPEAEAQAAPAPVVDPVLTAGREYTALLYSDRHDQLRTKFSPQMKSAMSGSDLFGIRQQIEKDLGGEVEVLSEGVEPYQGYKMYKRKIRVAKQAEAIEVQWVLDEQLYVVGLFVEAAP